MLTFATFYVDNAGLSRPRGNAITMIPQLFNSASLYHDKCKKLVLTDYKTQFPYLDRRVIIHRCDVDPRTMVLSKIAATRDYLKQTEIYDDVVLLDCDILITGNMEEVFKNDFDLGLTYRKHEDMPINSGVVFIKAGGRERAISFLEKSYNNLKLKDRKEQVILGDQLAYSEVVGYSNIPKEETAGEVFVETETASVLLLPCNEYNFSPEKKYVSILKEIKGKKVLHFKGRCKHLMYLYWHIYLERLYSPGLLSLFKALYNRFILMCYVLMGLIVSIKPRY